MNEPLTPEEYAMLLQLGGDNAELQQEIQRQQALADGLRTNDFGQMRGNGRIQVAPGLLETGANIFRNYRAGQMDDAIKAQSGQVLGNTRKQNEVIMKGILGRGPGIQSPGSVPGMTPGFNPYEQLKLPGGSA